MFTGHVSKFTQPPNLSNRFSRQCYHVSYYRTYRQTFRQTRVHLLLSLQFPGYSQFKYTSAWLLTYGIDWSQIQMSIESAGCTAYLTTVVRLTPLVTSYEIFTVELRMTLTFDQGRRSNVNTPDDSLFNGNRNLYHRLWDSPAWTSEILLTGYMIFKNTSKVMKHNVANYVNGWQFLISKLLKKARISKIVFVYNQPTKRTQTTNRHTIHTLTHTMA